MKQKRSLLFPLFFALSLWLYAEEPAGDDVTVTEDEEELPEYTDPPYSIGDRAFIQGYYLPLADDISLNFRVLNNRMFVYWVDADDLIVEPQASSGNVRFVAYFRARNFYELEPLNGEDGLGSVGGPIVAPHLFTAILSLEKGASEEFEAFNFRHTPGMEDKRETRDFAEVETQEPKSKRRYY